ncbi:hypothetical protein Goklo_006363, partial [Gossypium klotzschianum]|nr:hypothetical protein [Gossypium klotzschianum]
GSPDQESVGSGTKRSSVSSGSKSRNHKEFLYRLVDCETFTANLEDWFQSLYEKSAQMKPVFDVPFELIDLQKFDYALEGVSFQQLIRMPNAVYASTSDSAEATAYLAVEDFLHATAENAIASGRLRNLCASGVLLKNLRHPHGKWDNLLKLSLLRPGIQRLVGESEQKPSLHVLGEALFYALRMLISRSLSRQNLSLSSNSAFVLLVDSQYGGVVKVEGDVNKMDFDVNNVYKCAAEWIQRHARIAVSPVDRIWNKLGNANWGDIGALQVTFATFYCIMQFAGLPKHSIEDLAADHGCRLQTRRLERQLGDTRVNGSGLFRFQQHGASPKIVEVQDESVKLESESLKLEVGSILWLEDSN